jgi:hypothetical protein
MKISLYKIFVLFIYLGKGRLHNFNYGLYWPLWDVICGTRYRDQPNTNGTMSISDQDEKHEEKKFT